MSAPLLPGLIRVSSFTWGTGKEMFTFFQNSLLKKIDFLSKLLRPPGNSVIFKKLVYYIKIIFPREFLSRRREESMELLQRVNNYIYNILYTYLFMIPKLIFVLYFMLYVSILYTYCVYIILLFIEELNIIL